VNGVTIPSNRHRNTFAMTTFTRGSRRRPCGLEFNQCSAVVTFRVVSVLIVLVIIAYIFFQTDTSSDVVQPSFPMLNLERAHSLSNVNNNNKMIQKTFASFSNDEIKRLISLWTMVGPLHLDLVFSAVEKFNTMGLEGALVECGVWKGGTSLAMVIANQRHNTDRHIYLFDTFEGLPEPTSNKNGLAAKRLFKELHNKNVHNVSTNEIDMLIARRDIEDGKWVYGPLDVVKNNLYYSGYPQEKIHFVQGKVEDTLMVKANLPDKIALLRLDTDWYGLDTDWYESTKIELEVLYDRLVPGGLLVVDDYCIWPGSMSAVDEYFREKLGLDAAELSKASTPCFHFWKPLDDHTTRTP
jgi:O-methyltransferase